MCSLKMLHVTAIVLAAGKGLRFKSAIPKPVALINRKPVFLYSLSVLDKHPNVKEIILVVNLSNKRLLLKEIRKCNIEKLKKIVIGGKQRRDSVRRGLKFVSGLSNLILIHDGVRPFIDKDIISRLVLEAAASGAAIVGVPVKDTIKEIQNPKSKIQKLKIVKKTLKRENLWQVQTPQVFKKDLIIRAYNKFGRMAVTDDASLVEKLGVKVRIVTGSYFNIKITTAEDLVLAKAISKNGI